MRRAATPEASVTSEESRGCGLPRLFRRRNPGRVLGRRATHAHAFTASLPRVTTKTAAGKRCPGRPDAGAAARTSAPATTLLRRSTRHCRAELPVPRPVQDPFRRRARVGPAVSERADARRPRGSDAGSRRPSRGRDPRCHPAASNWDSSGAALDPARAAPARPGTLAERCSSGISSLPPAWLDATDRRCCTGMGRACQLWSAPSDARQNPGTRVSPLRRARRSDRPGAHRRRLDASLHPDNELVLDRWIAELPGVEQQCVGPGRSSPPTDIPGCFTWRSRVSRITRNWATGPSTRELLGKTSEPTERVHQLGSSSPGSGSTPGGEDVIREIAADAVIGG